MFFTYFLRYYFVPTDIPCLTFPGEFGVVTKSYYAKAFPTVSQRPCDELSRANQMFLDDPVTIDARVKSYTLYQSGRNFSVRKSFTLTRNALFQGLLNYMFFPGHVYLRFFEISSYSFLFFYFIF